MRVVKIYVRGRTPPPPALDSWELFTVEGHIKVMRVLECADGSCVFVGVIHPVDGGKPVPVRGEISRTGHVFLAPLAGWAGLV